MANNIKVDKDISTDISTLENLVENLRKKAKSCDPNIVYPLGQIQTVTDRLFTKYDEIRTHPVFGTRFNILIRNFETYRGDYTYNCTCQRKT